MNNQQINQVSTIIRRYAELNSAAKVAKNAITEVMHLHFQGALTEEERTVLYHAMDIIDTLQDKTNSHRAVEHATSLI